MKLLIDAGNQRCKCATYDGASLKRYPPVEINDNIRTYLSGDICRNKANISEVWVSSTRDQTFNRQLAVGIQSLLGQSLIFAEVTAEVGGCKTRYNRRMLGVDRFLSLIGAWSNLHRACFVIDCGTAVTVDALDKHGVHQGGVVMPGLTMMKDALYKNTAQLAMADGGEVLFPKNTADAVESGCRHLLMASVITALDNMRATMDGLCVVTGGDGKWLADKNEGFVYFESLVLEGLAVVATE